MYMIYNFSAQPGEVSAQLSYQVSYELVETADYVFETGLDDWQIEQWAYRMHGVTRKLAHMVEYFALAIAMSFPLYVYGVHGIWLMLLAGMLCVGFACGDEYHQSFVEGRGPSIRDVAIDSFGIFWGIILVRIIGWTGRKTIFRPRKKRQRKEDLPPSAYQRPDMPADEYVMQRYAQQHPQMYQQPYMQPGSYPPPGYGQPNMQSGEYPPPGYGQPNMQQGEYPPPGYGQSNLQPGEYPPPGYGQPQPWMYQQPYVQPQQPFPGQTPQGFQQPYMQSNAYPQEQASAPNQTQTAQAEQMSAEQTANASTDVPDNTTAYERHPYHPYTRAHEFASTIPEGTLPGKRKI